MKSKFIMKLAAVCVSATMFATMMLPSVSAIANTSITSVYSSATEILNLKTNNYTIPLTVEDANPVFSWEMDSNLIGQQQKAYQIVVTRDSDGKVVWDSGRVEGSQSNDVYYQGEALTAETAYSWDLTVWDAFGQSYTRETRFETGLMDPTLDAWDGAQFIGSKEMSIDAASCNLFTIETDIEVITGTKASLIFGADDYRFQNQFQNVWNVGGENYVRLEFDIADVTPEGGQAVLRLYKKGFDDDGVSENGAVSEVLFSETKIPSNVIHNENKYGPNNFSIYGCNSAITVSINGQKIANNAAFNKLTNGKGGDSNYNTYPHLNSVGFAAEAGDRFEATNYKIMVVGNNTSEEAKQVFGQNLGASYDIFKELDGVTVSNNGNRITVNGGSEGILGYADPSYGSLKMVRNTFSTDTEKTVASAKMYVTAMGIYEMYINGERMMAENADGEKVADWFNPADSQYRDTLCYHAYDVSDMIADGENAMGAILGGGWYTGYQTYTTAGNYSIFGDYEALLAKLVITYEDGSTETVVTDPSSWTVYNDGPTRAASFYQGERYDASKEAAVSVDGNVNGWATTAYDSSAWTQCENIEPREWINFDIVGRYETPIREYEWLDTTRILSTHSEDNTTYTYDMGVVMTGVPSITIPAGSLKEGDTVVMRYGEDIYPGNEDSQNTNEYYTGLYGPEGTFRKGVAGRVLHDTYRAAMASDFYIASKEDETRDVVIQPGFTFRSYRYVQITVPSRTEALPAENVHGVVISSIEKLTGTYNAATTDDTITGYVNQLFKNIQRSQLGNFMSIPTDCPQRNERMGWTGDAQAFSRTSTYNADTLKFFRQWMVALRDDQGGNGSIGNTVPAFSTSDPKKNTTSFADGSTWAAAVCMVPWQMYTQYGDTTIVEENMDAMKLWLDGMDSYDFDAEHTHLSSKTGGLADWLSVDGKTSSDIVNNAIYIYMMEVTAEMARAIGRTDIADELQERHDLAKEEWNDVYFNEELGLTTDKSGKIMDSQASYATPLNFNCFSDENLEAANARLAVLAADPNQSGNGAGVSGGGGFGGGSSGQVNCPEYSITTGFSGTPNILPALTRGGNVEEAYNMFTCTDYASWLYSVKMGSTTMWERWNSYELAFQDNGNSGMNSFNHFALGSVGSWLYEFQLGITTDHANGGAGYQDFVLQPLAGGNFTALEGSYESNYGTIESSWTADAGSITSYSATVPANTSATLYLPADASVVEHFENITGVTYTGMTTRNGVSVATFRLASGSFDFKVADGTLTASVADGYEVAAEADKSILNDVIAYAEAQKADISYGSVIPMVQETFEAALEAAKAVAADTLATDDAVFDAWVTLMGEIHKLGFVQGDKTSLAKLISAAGTIEANLDNYIEAGKAEFVCALAAARSVYADENALQDEVDPAATALLDAMVTLRLKADKSLLEQTMTIAASIDITAYTDETIAAFNAASDNANAVYANEAATQDEVDKAQQDLQAAIDGLKAVETAAETGVSVAGDKTVTTGGGNAKTGENQAAAMAATALVLAAAAFALTKKKRR